MNFKEIKVLLLDGYGRQIPGMLWMLHDLGCEITTLNSSKLDPGYASRYPDHKIVVKGLKDDLSIMEKAIEEYQPDILIFECAERVDRSNSVVLLAKTILEGN